MIRDGKILTIPSTKTQPKLITKTTFVPIELSETVLTHEYASEQPLDKITLIPNPNSNAFALNGLILSNDAPGIIYSGIVVNGAKCSDYNKFPLFFEQLPALQPDLIIISLGTNESFDKQTFIRRKSINFGI